MYSIDECFIDVTGYLHMYLEEAKRTGTNPAHVMVMTMIREVLSATGITATVGIGTNLYLAKVSMDIVAKKQPADKDGVRIAELNEDSYKFLLWDHQPLTDFWQIGPGKARRLYKAYMFTMAISLSGPNGMRSSSTSNSASTERSCWIMHGVSSRSPWPTSRTTRVRATP